MKKKSIAHLITVYPLLLVVTIASCVFINFYGSSLFPTANLSDISRPDSLKHYNDVMHVLLALAVVIAVARIIGKLFSYLKQPPVIGEVIGGIILGPSLLGKVSPEISHYILPSSVAPFLSIIAQLGIILYMFLVGLELDLKVLKKSGSATLAISHASIAFPFLLGTLLALYLFQDLAPDGVSFSSFSLFLGISMSVTAFPVLARILTDKGIHRSSFGTIALTCAAVDDVTAWCLLAFVVSITHASYTAAISTVMLTALYIAIMLVAIRPLVQRATQRLEKKEPLTEGELAIICLGILISALATESIGIHAIFGAFLLGAIVPHESKVAHELTFRLQDLIQVLFLPAFFAFTGMRTEVGLLDSSADWLICVVIIVVATMGKFGGTLVVSRWFGFSWRKSAGLGVLMNTRGLVELIVLNIGLDLRVISPQLFTMLVLMALVTTFMTGPALQVVLGKTLEEQLRQESLTLKESVRNT